MQPPTWNMYASTRRQKAFPSDNKACMCVALEARVVTCFTRICFDGVHLPVNAVHTMNSSSTATTTVPRAPVT